MKINENHNFNCLMNFLLQTRIVYSTINKIINSLFHLKFLISNHDSGICSGFIDCFYSNRSAAGLERKTASGR